MAVLESPIAGKILKINAQVGQTATEDDELFVIESMKMENPIYGDAGLIKEIRVKVGEHVQEGDVLAIIE